jgi:hypothetical protein
MDKVVEVQYTRAQNTDILGKTRFLKRGLLYMDVGCTSLAFSNTTYKPAAGREGVYVSERDSAEVTDILYLCACTQNSIHECPKACPKPSAQAIKNLHLAENVADSSKEGRKNGKIRMELVFEGMPNALQALGKCMTWAIEAKGYEELDFLTVPNGPQKYRGAMYRHDQKEILGEEFDDESGLIHATHTAWNAMARLELLLREGKSE